MKWAICGELVHLHFFCENTKWKKGSSPHYLKMIIKLSTHGLSYSLKHDPRSIYKKPFYANLRVSPIHTELWEFFKKTCWLLFKSAIFWPEWGHLDGFAKWSFDHVCIICWKLSDNVGIILFFIWYFQKKNEDEPVHHILLISSVWKLKPNPVD